MWFSYHSVEMDSVSVKKWKNSKSVEWLWSKSKAVDRSLVKVQLIDKVDALQPQCDKYIIDKLAKSHKKIVLHLSSYESELNPIELLCLSVKHYVLMNNSTY